MKITVWLLPVFAALALGQTFQWPFQGAGPRRGQPFVVPSRESAFHDEDDAYWPHYSHEDDAGNAYWNNAFHPAVSLFVHRMERHFQKICLFSSTKSKTKQVLFRIERKNILLTEV